MTYCWQLPGWPEFQVRNGPFQEAYRRFSEKTGRIDGMFAHLSARQQVELSVELMTEEAMKTSKIEGEFLQREDVMSSIRNRLGVNQPPARVRNPKAEGVGHLMILVRDEWNAPLTEPMLHHWHRELMRGSGLELTGVGTWRTHPDPMQVVSGPVGDEVVHYEAPPSERIPLEMRRFLEWVNGPAPTHPAPERAALAHLRFESIHPYENGNGRIGRCLAEKCLSQSIGRPAILSLSRILEEHRTDYYAALKQAQRSLDATDWVGWFTDILLSAQTRAEELTAFTIRKAKLFDRNRDNINPRQEKALARMLREGPDGFKGGMSAKKYMSITGTSKATATRDLQGLRALGVLAESGAGRGTRYHVAF